MTAKQAAAFLDVDRSTLDRLRIAWYIRATRVGRARNAKILYTRESLAAFIEDPPDTIDCEAIMAERSD
ncbi:MAG: helix-turn-helix domain-containing protein [Planctomycetota bacterium]|nr:helix-turn-helix domain-containing protein [Planctomycetota bacterium]